MVIIRRCRVGERGDVSQRVKTSSYKIKTFWGYNIQHCDYILKLLNVICELYFNTLKKEKEKAKQTLTKRYNQQFIEVQTTGQSTTEQAINTRIRKM